MPLTLFGACALQQSDGFARKAAADRGARGGGRSRCRCRWGSRPASDWARDIAFSFELTAWKARGSRVKPSTSLILEPADPASGRTHEQKRHPRGWRRLCRRQGHQLGPAKAHVLRLKAVPAEHGRVKGGTKRKWQAVAHVGGVGRAAARYPSSWDAAGRPAPTRAWVVRCGPEHFLQSQGATIGVLTGLSSEDHSRLTPPAASVAASTTRETS